MTSNIKGKFRDRINNIKKMYNNSNSNKKELKKEEKKETKIEENIIIPKVSYERYGIPVISEKKFKQEIEESIEKTNQKKQEVNAHINEKPQKKVKQESEQDKIISKRDIVLKKIKNKLKKEINELEVIESELYLINEGRLSYKDKQELEEDRNKILLLFNKVKKIKEQYQIFKDNPYLDDIIWLDDSTLVDDIIEFKNMVNSSNDIKLVTENLKLYEEYKFLYDEVAKIEKENIRLEEANQRKLAELKEQDERYDAYINSSKEFEIIALKMDRFLVKQDKAMSNLSKKIEHITETEVIEHQIKNLDKLLYFNAKYFFALLLTPLKGVFPSIAMNAISSKQMVENIRKTVHIEEIKRKVYQADDYISELNYTLYSLNDVSSILDNNIDNLSSLETEIKEKFLRYDSDKVERILQNIKKMRKILDNNRYKLEKVKTSVYGNIKKNEKVKKKVLELNKK